MLTFKQGFPRQPPTVPEVPRQPHTVPEVLQQPPTVPEVPRSPVHEKYYLKIFLNGDKIENKYFKEIELEDDSNICDSVYEELSESGSLKIDCDGFKTEDFFKGIWIQ